jgi:hypothetical protein
MEVHHRGHYQHHHTPPSPGRRLYIGLALLCASFFTLPLGLFLQRYINPEFWRAFTVTVGWLMAPLLKLSAIAVFGKSTYLWIVSKLKSHFFVYIFPKKPSRTRYYIGVVLFLLPAVVNHMLSYAPHRLHIDPDIRFYIQIANDFIFVVSLILLGGDFWEKLRGLFYYDFTGRRKNL